MATESARYIEVLSPIAGHRLRDVSLAQRPSDLSGKVLGLLDNGKPNADLLVAAVGEAIAAAYPLKDVVKRSKSEGVLGAAGPMPEAMREHLIKHCDLVINAIGD